MTQGKGSTPRPKAVPESEYADNWARTFCPPLRDPVDSRELMRQRNLKHAERVVTGTPCTDYPTEQ
jgi:hypothetical protein